MSQRFSDDIKFIPYAINFAGYIDAIQRIAIDDFLPAFAQTTTPVGMEAGLNFWEPHGTWLIHGTDVSGMVNFEVVARDDDGWIDHQNIPNQHSIWTEMVRRVGIFMPQM